MWVETDDGDLVNLDHAAGIEFREHHGPQEKVTSYSVFAEMGEGSKLIRTFRVDRPADAKQGETQARAFMGAIRDVFRAKDSLVPWDKPHSP